MAGRSTFFSFHYKRDVWRASIVRNAGQVDARAAAGWRDSSLWEEAEKKGDAVIQKMIDDALVGTSVTAVLIGAKAAQRRWVKYEIKKSIERGNGLLGVHIHQLENAQGLTDVQGAVPTGLTGYKVYTYNRNRFGAWVEKAAVAAGKKCLKHRLSYCTVCG